MFPQVYGFSAAGPGVVENVEVVATKNPDAVSRAELRERNREREIGVDLGSEIESYRGDETDDVPILRDDYAPVDDLLDPMVGQRYVIQETDPVNWTTG